MTQIWKPFVVSLLVACLILAAWLAFRKESIPQNEDEVFKRAYELQKAGRYDKAVHVLQTWTNDSRRDVSKDDFLYFEIAMVYMAKAHKKSSTKGESAHQAELNLEKALDIINKNKSGDLDVMLFEVGGAYELLGDMSNKDKCRLYEIARQAFERQLPLIKGDSYTAHGHTTQLEPVRGDVRKHLDAVKGESSRAGCQAHSE
jgi:tetratricopeptide (TPR) repeat protein